MRHTEQKASRVGVKGAMLSKTHLARKKLGKRAVLQRAVDDQFRMTQRHHQTLGCRTVAQTEL